MLTLGMVSVASAEFAPVNKDDLKVGFVFIGDVSDKGFTYAHYQGLLDMQQNLGLSDDQILIKTNVSEDSSCETAAARAGGSRLPDHLRQLLRLHELHG